MPARRIDFIRLARRISKSLEELSELPEKIVSEPLEAEIKRTLLEKLYSFNYRGEIAKEDVEAILGAPLDEYVKSYTARLLSADHRVSGDPDSESGEQGRA